jgi:hypothetical protein
MPRVIDVFHGRTRTSRAHPLHLSLVNVISCCAFFSVAELDFDGAGVF